MTKIRRLVFLAILTAACKSPGPAPGSVGPTGEGDFRIAFGSCNRTELENRFWDDILHLEPDLWIWGGDNIYADTGDMIKMRELYEAQNQVPGYRELSSAVPVIGTWDDHDYGMNDGGMDYPSREASQQEFLNFMGVAADSPRRKQEGIYSSHDYSLPGGSVKVLVLDTRYFRTPLRKGPTGGKKYLPNDYGEGTILGEQQWDWLAGELAGSDADFNILVSSIQVLSGDHGFETWGNFPHEVDRLIRIIGNSGARGVFILSGDRHISEFSSRQTEAISYPLVDFTSSGLTHAYRNFQGEPNPYRRGEVVARESYGLVVLDLKKRTATFRMLGDGNLIQQEIRQGY